MPEFEEVRRFLEERFEQLTQTVEDPAQFQREFDNLRRYWQQEDDQTLMLEETWRVVHKYPPVWEALADAGLVPEEEGPAVPERASQEPEQVQPTPSQPIEETAMNEQRCSQSTLERLAIWDKQLATGKEIVTGCMGILIILVTLLVAIIAILSVSNAETRAAAKDVLLFLNGLVGVVLGYYFGRVPGEVRADKAESEAKTIRSELDRTVTEVRGIIEERGVDLERGGAPREVQLTAEQVERLRNVLRRF